MNRNTLLKTIAVMLAMVAFAAAARAQDSTSAPALKESLAMLPEAESIVFVNPARIYTDALPRLLTDKQYQDVKNGAEQVKGFTAVDVKNIEYVILEMRFMAPTEGSLYPLPEVLLVIRGDFNASSLIGMAVMASGGKLREDKYESHTLHVLKLSDVMGDMSKMPYGTMWSEVAMATLDSSTLVVGTPSYIKAAFDVVDGRSHPNTAVLASAMRNPNSLLSMAGTPLRAIAKSLGIIGGPESACNCMTRFGEFYASLDMEPTSFKISGAMHADNPTTANLVKNFLLTMIEQFKGLITDPQGKAVVNQLKLTTQASEVLIEANIPQADMAKAIQEMIAPPKPPAAATQATTVSAKPPATTRKRTRRRK